MTRAAPLLRPATPDDEAFLLGLMGRLAAFPVPEWRTAEEIASADNLILIAALREPKPSNLVLIAEDPTGTPVGGLLVSTATDYFTGRQHAHIEVVAVTVAASGRGLGRAMIDAAERWAVERGYEQITLTVFATNEAARAIYEHLGYRAETIRYWKRLDGGAT